MRSIAAACGLGHATVGRALSGHPNVSNKNRELVLQTAERMGYRPDPMLSALSRRRWPVGAKSGSVTLAWLYFSESTHAGTRSLRPEADAARQRAAELGYQLELFDLENYPSGSRLSDVLLARGIRGVLVQAFRESISLELNWDRFCTVFVGPENDEIHVHNVQADFRATVRVAVRECVRCGYKKPAFALMNYRASGTSEPIFAQTLAERERLKKLDIRQPEIFHWDASQPELAAGAHAWIRSSRPDCLIASNAAIFFWLANPRHFGVSKFKPVRIPEDLPAISLRQESAIPGLAFTGLREREQGIEAVNLLHRQLQHGGVGVPDVPMRMLVPPEFVPGRTLPEKVVRFRRE